MNESDVNEDVDVGSSVNKSGAAKKYVAEMIGTFVLVLMGCGSAVLAGSLTAGIVGISFAFGISLFLPWFTL